MKAKLEVTTGNFPHSKADIGIATPYLGGVYSLEVAVTEAISERCNVITQPFKVYLQ